MTPKPGNKNAQKHGIYSQFIAVIDNAEALETMSGENNRAELAYARSRLVNAQTEYKNALAAEDKLKWDYACRHWTEIIDGMISRNVKKGETEHMIFQSLIEAIRAANDSQKIVQ